MGQLFSLPRQQAFDNDGDPVPAARLFFYENLTTTPKNVYSDADLNAPHTNPVIADAFGVFDAIWLDTSTGNYSVTLTDSANVQLWAEDDVGASDLTLGRIAALLYPETDAEASVTVVNMQYPVGNFKRYGAVGDGATDDTAAVQSALTVAQVAGGKAYGPAGDYKITAPLTIDGQLSALPANFGLTLYGDGRRTTRLVSSLAAGDMLTIGNASGTPQNGVSIHDIGFAAAGTSAESALLRLDYGLDARIWDCLFDGGADTQVVLARAQNVWYYGNENRGDGTRTQIGVLLTEGASLQAGQGTKLTRNTIRGMRAGGGVGLWLKNDGGGEHSVLSNIIEGNLIGLFLESSRHLVFDNSFENAVATDTQIKVGSVPPGTLSSHHNIARNTLSARSHLNFKCIDLVQYSDIRIDSNHFFSDNGTHVYFGADENNVPSYFTNNECPMSALSLAGTDGKVVVSGNSANGTNNPRGTATAGDATPSVANIDVLATANTGATTITDFDNGYPGKLLMVAVEDAVTTIQNNANIVTLSASNLTPGGGERYIFMAYVGSTATAAIVWIQLK